MSTTAPLVSRKTPEDLRIFLPEKIILAAITAAYLAIALHSAYRRPFWFDELSTLFVASTPSLRAMFHAIPADGNPPLYFLLARFFLHLPIKLELALRFPAILAFLFAMLTIYVFVRRIADPVFASLAMALFLGAHTIQYAVEARPYSLLLAFTGLTLCCWQSYCRTGKGIALFGIWVGIVGAILSHQYGAIDATLPILVGEAVFSIRQRTIDMRPLLIIAAAVPALFLTIPPMLHGQRELLAAVRACPFAWTHPLLIDLAAYTQMLPPFFYPLVMLAALGWFLKIAISRPVSPHGPRLGCPAEDLAVALTLSLITPLIIVVSRLETGFFQPGYAVGSAMGLAILITILLARWRIDSPLAWTASIYCIVVGLLVLWYTPHPEATLPWSDPVLYAGPASEPIVVASALEFSPAWWYSDGSLRPRLHCLKDLGYALHHSNPTAEYSLWLERDSTPMQLDDYYNFLATHQHFLLYCFGEPRIEWIKQRLINEGWHLTLLSSAKKQPTGDDGQQYRELYQVIR